MHYLLGVVALAALLSGCATSPTEHAEPQNADGLQSSAYQTCPEQRPEMCTYEYRPVCGLTGDEQWRTYGNGCTACADTQVQGYLEGECNSTAPTN